MGTARVIAVSGAIVGIALVACTSSLDLDRFRKAESANTLQDAASIDYLDVRLTFTEMTSHLNEVMEVRIVDTNNRIRAKALFADIPGKDFSIYLGRVIPQGTAGAPFRIDWWADHNLSGKYDGIVGGINDKDHAWRRVLDPANLPGDVAFVDGRRFELNFIHDTDFIDILLDPKTNNPISAEVEFLPLKLKVSGVEAFREAMIELRVAEKKSKRLIALHRQGRPKEAYVATVTDVLDEETTYEVSVYVDADRDGKYTPPGDPSWKTEITSTSAGIDQEINLATLPQSPIETGEPAPK